MIKILLVDDEANLTRLMKANLERTGRFSVRTENHGSKALEAAREFGPDLILLDIMLPQISGYDICRSVRQDPGLSGVKILIMTARGSALQRDQAMSVGADGFFAKPFSLDDLREKIRGQLA